jgi:broad specificity phosphatase PhoE
MGRPSIPYVNDTAFRDTPLCPEGIENIIYNRKQLRNTMGAVDVIFTSPLKRCIETTLLSYQDVNTSSFQPIHTMSLLMEYSKGAESIGVPMSQMKNDPTVFCYRHYPSLDYRYFMEGFHSNHYPSNLGFNEHTLEWTILDYRSNHQRTKWFFDFVRTRFRGKRIHVVTHSMFMYSFLGFIPNNYETVRVLYNPDTGEIKWDKIFPNH